jgi:N-dimethylarginine dimethylaminohydrolase
MRTWEYTNCVVEEKEFDLIEVTEEEVFANAGNIINIGNDTIISHTHATGVNERLKALGFKIEVLEISELFKIYEFKRVDPYFSLLGNYFIIIGC